MEITHCNVCGRCPFLEGDKTDRCCIYGIARNIDDVCAGYEESMNSRKAIKVLHVYQKWRRGCGGKMPDPVVIGAAIDVAIRELRQKIRPNKVLACRVKRGYNYVCIRNVYIDNRIVYTEGKMYHAVKDDYLIDDNGTTSYVTTEGRDNFRLKRTGKTK